MIVDKITFEEKLVDEEFETTTLYFIAPKAMLNGKFPGADFMTISVKFPNSNPEPSSASVMFSPAIFIKEDEAFEDYAWFDVEISKSKIAELMKLGGF